MSSLSAPFQKINLQDCSEVTCMMKVKNQVSAWEPGTCWLMGWCGSCMLLSSSLASPSVLYCSCPSVSKAVCLTARLSSLSWVFSYYVLSVSWTNRSWGLFLVDCRLVVLNFEYLLRVYSVTRLSQTEVGNSVISVSGSPIQLRGQLLHFIVQFCLLQQGAFCTEVCWDMFFK